MIVIYNSEDGFSINKFDTIKGFIEYHFADCRSVEEFINKLELEFEIEEDYHPYFVIGKYYKSKTNSNIEFQIIINETPSIIKINYKPSIEGFE